MTFPHCRNTITWIDKAPCLYCNYALKFGFVSRDIRISIKRASNDINRYNSLCLLLIINDDKQLFPAKCRQNVCNTYFCEIPTNSIEFVAQEKTKPTFNNTNNLLTSPSTMHPNQLENCENGHVTRNFISCDIEGPCDVQTKMLECPLNDNFQRFHDLTKSVKLKNIDSMTKFSLKLQQYIEVQRVTVKMFECLSYDEIISYTFVCDFKKHCFDGSDEAFCQHLQITSAKLRYV